MQNAGMHEKYHYFTSHKKAICSCHLPKVPERSKICGYGHNHKTFQESKLSCLCVPGSTAGEREVPEVLLEPGVRPPLVLPALQVQAHEVAPLEGRAQQGDLAGRVLRVGLIVELSQARNRVRFSDSFTTK